MKAYSYVRYSSAKQNFSDSFRRQSEGTQKWCNENNFEYDEKGFGLYKDLGVSGSTGANIHKATSGLNLFLNDVREGKIKTPCVLVIEALDRLTRLNIRAAFRVVEDLIDLGVQIATVQDNKIYNEKTLDTTFELINLLNKLDASNQYTETLGIRSKASWGQKHKVAAQTGELITRVLPCWLKFDEKEKRIISVPEYVKIIQRIYEEYLKGEGVDTIAKNLNAEGISPPSVWMKMKYVARNRSANGINQTLWSPVTIRRILMSPAVYGVHQPHTNVPTRSGMSTKKIPQGKPIENYYPEIIPKSIYNQVQASKRKRATFSGPRKHHGNLFHGYVRCMLCGYNMLYYRGSTTKVSNPEKYQYLACKQWRRAKKCEPIDRGNVFTYQNLEDAIVSEFLSHIFQDIYSPQTSERYLSIQEELKTKREQIRVQNDAMRDYASKGIAIPEIVLQIINELTEEEKVLSEELQAAPKGDNDFYSPEKALEEIELGLRKTLEPTLENRMMVSEILRGWIHQIQIDPVTWKVCIITTLCRRSESFLKKTRTKDLKKINVCVWLDMKKINRDYDGGYATSGWWDGDSKLKKGIEGKMNKKNPFPEERDYNFADYKNFLLWDYPKH
jgi:DNA invertase Pin-like site-specific DNA recombinase